ncbi:MAG: ABC transporter permease [Planctomycetota bacterium]
MIDLVVATLLAATPLLLAALGGLCSERGGVVNIGLEGMILTGAFFATATTLLTGSPVLGLLGGTAAGAVLGLVHGYVSMRLRVDQVVSGVAINLLASAGTLLCLKTFYGSKGSSPQLPEGALGSIGPFSPITLLAVLAVPLVFLAVYRTKWGLRLRACGENPEAADAVGIDVFRTRLSGVVVSGALSGLGGVILAFTAGSFVKEMSAGRGFIALAAVVFGRWRPIPTAIGCLIFASGQAVTNTLELGFKSSSLEHLMPGLPYVLTLLVLAARPLLFRGRRTGPPAAVGRNFVRD